MKSIITLFIALAACQTDPPELKSVQDQCGASGYANLIGQSSDIFASMTFPAPMRIIEHGMAITMEFSAARLNFDLDKNHNIQRVWCG